MKQFSSFLLAISFFLFSCSSSRPRGSANNWKFIADKQVDYGLDRDVIYTGNIRDDFRQLKFRVTDAPLRMMDLKIYFDNGSIQDVPIRNNIKVNGETKVIDLEGGLRHLSKIEFWYSTAGRFKGKSRIAVWGK